LLVEDDLSLSWLVVSLELLPVPAAPPLELDGEALLGEVVDPDEDAEPDGGEDIEPDGEVVEPEGDVPRSLERLQPVTTAVPSARVTASAKVESLMKPPW
jgi:hypothetical protein